MKEKLIKTGLIGCGKWGSKILEKLKLLSDVKFICNTKNDYRKMLDNVDWVFVASPNETHFEIVENCIYKHKNVFCEKPLTLTKMETIDLYRIAEKSGRKIYVDDIHNFREYNIDFKESNSVIRYKSGGGNTRDILYRLTYHDIYLLFDYIKHFQIKNIIPIDTEYNLHFKIDLGEKYIKFYYNLNSDSNKHYINNKEITGKDDILLKMISNVLCNRVDYNKNKEISIFTNGYIDLINAALF